MTFKLPNDPFFIGFDKFFEGMVEVPKETNYPPYNLIKTGDESYMIELAVAGFDEEDLNIKLHDSVLTISANISDKDEDVEYLHKGIAARSFVRKFTVADTIEVGGASLHMGMLTIQLKNVVPEENKPKTIPINGKSFKKSLLTE